MNALIWLALAQLMAAGVIAGAAELVLRRPEVGSSATRERIAAMSFFGAAILPLAALTPQSIEVVLGPEETPLGAWSSPNLPESESGILIALVALAVAVSAVRAARTMAAVWRGERLAANSVRLDATAFGLPAGVRLAESPVIAGPLVAGLFQPRILLPPRLATAPVSQVRPLLRHELAHLQRGDLPRALVARLATDLYWWSPAIAWLSRRLGEQREFACDAFAAGSEPGEFALRLIDEARARATPLAPMHTLGASGILERRLDRLVRGRRPASAMALLLLAAALACSLAFVPRLPGGHTYVAVASH